MVFAVSCALPKRACDEGSFIPVSTGLVLAMGNEASRVGNQASFLEDAGSSPTGRTPSVDDEPEEEEEEQSKIPSKLSDTMVVLLNLLRSGKLKDPDLLFIIASMSA